MAAVQCCATRLIDAECGGARPPPPPLWSLSQQLECRVSACLTGGHSRGDVCLQDVQSASKPFQAATDQVLQGLRQSGKNASRFVSAFTSLLHRMSDTPARCSAEARQLESHCFARLCDAADAAMVDEEQAPTVAAAFVTALLSCIDSQRAPAMRADDAGRLFTHLHERHLASENGTNGNAHR